MKSMMTFKRSNVPKSQRRRYRMVNIIVLLQKEWLEFKQQRMLLLSVLIVPFFLTLIPVIALYAIGTAPASGNTSQSTRELMQSNPTLAGMNEQEATQAVMGQAFSSMFLLMPMILPS